MHFPPYPGSGRIKLRDGVIMRVGYAGTNGHAYTAIDRELIARGEIPREKMSMQAIRAWLEINPADGAELMRTNRSYVFFRELTGDGPLGAQGVELTEAEPGDRPATFAAGPACVAGYNGTRRNAVSAPDDRPGYRRSNSRRGSRRRVLGSGTKAADQAGKMQSPGRYWILVPRALRPAS